MCGIVGFTGNHQAAPILLYGLSRLEYRGYDSAGLAVRDGEGDIEVIKAKGRLKVLADKTNNGESVPGTCGIGHTRWATHGEPSETNAHPHMSDDGNVVAVHNGIIENYQELKDKLIRNGYEFYSSTDTEVAVKLVDYYYKKYLGTPVDAINHAMVRIRGSYALAIMFKDYPGEIYVARKDSPMILGVDGENSYIASDVPAIIHYTRDYYLLDQNEIAVIKKDSVKIYDVHGNEIHKELNTADWDVDAAEKGGYAHFMLKEIHEQPDSVKRTIMPRIMDDMPDFSAEGFNPDKLKNYKNIYIVACGTAMYAGMVGKTMIQNRLHIPVTVAIASEFRYEEPVINEKSMVIVVSQSGETIDTLEALRLANKYTKKTLSIVNVKGSSIARESSYVLYTHAGPEIAVASTKAYTVQVASFYLLACKLAMKQQKISVEEARTFIGTLQEIPNYIEEVLAQAPDIEQLTKRMINANNAFFIGRGLDYTLCMEGALKLKEISYIHAEAYAAGELKHGTIALVSEGVPVIAAATQKHVYSKVISNIREVKARGAYVILLSKDKEITDPSICDVHINLPDVSDEFTIFESVVIFQLIAYYTSVGKGLNPDQPRNLAKSVTVE